VDVGAATPFRHRDATAGGETSGSAVLDGVPDVLAAGHRHVLVEQQAEHVDAARLLLALGRGAIGLEEDAQLLALAGIDGLLGQTEGHATARLHLDEHERLAILGDDVDLPDLAAPIAREDAESLLLEILQGGVLTGMTDPFAERARRRERLGRAPAALSRCRSRRP
jgi:hypothetical protein